MILTRLTTYRLYIDENFPTNEVPLPIIPSLYLPLQNCLLSTKHLFLLIIQFNRLSLPGARVEPLKRG